MTRLVFDVGGTHARIARAEGNALSGEHITPTPKTPEAFMTEARAFLENDACGTTEAVGCIAGAVSGTMFVGGPNLLGWDNFDFGVAFRALGIASFTLLNDADAAGLGEALVGAGKCERVVAYLTLGTGVGGTLIVNGAHAPNAEGIEPGKQVIDFEHGRTLEDLVGGASMQKEFGMPAQDIPQTAFDERLPALAAGVYNSIRHFAPDVLVLGGGIILAGRYSLPALSEAVAKLAPPEARMPRIAFGTLGDQAGLVGSAVCESDSIAYYDPQLQKLKN